MLNIRTLNNMTEYTKSWGGIKPIIEEFECKANLHNLEWGWKSKWTIYKCKRYFLRIEHKHLITIVRIIARCHTRETLKMFREFY